MCCCTHTRPHSSVQMLGGILTYKLEGEDVIRASGVPYAIVRPCALTEEPGGMPLETDQGDVIKVVREGCGATAHEWTPDGRFEAEFPVIRPPKYPKLISFAMGTPTRRLNVAWAQCGQSGRTVCAVCVQSGQSGRSGQWPPPFPICLGPVLHFPQRWWSAVSRLHCDRNDRGHGRGAKEQKQHL